MPAAFHSPAPYLCLNILHNSTMCPDAYTALVNALTPALPVSWIHNMFMPCRRQIYWILIFLGTPPVYSAISRIPALQHSLADSSRWGAGMYIITILCKLSLRQCRLHVCMCAVLCCQMRLHGARSRTYATIALLGRTTYACSHA